MKKIGIIVLLAVLLSIAILAPVVGAVPLIEVPGSYLDPPDAFLLTDPIIHDGLQNGYILEISAYTREKYLGETASPLEYMHIQSIDGTSKDAQIYLAFKKQMYPYTEQNPQNWYPGWEPVRVGFTYSTNAEVTGS